MLKKNPVALFLFLLAILVARPEKIRAQDTLNFTPNGFLGMPDTVYAGFQTQVGVLLKNYSLFLYNDSISIDGYVDTGSAVVPFQGAIDTSFSLAPGDSQLVLIPFTFNDQNQGGYFRIGNNVIVVWPHIYSPSFTFSDSLRATVFVIDTTTGFGPEPKNDFSVRCFPVPSSGPLYVSSNHPSVKIKQLVIHDASGRLMLISKDPSQPFDLSSWPAGMYIMEVTFENGKTGRYKILRK